MLGEPDVQMDVCSVFHSVRETEIVSTFGDMKKIRYFRIDKKSLDMTTTQSHISMKRRFGRILSIWRPRLRLTRVCMNLWV